MKCPTAAAPSTFLAFRSVSHRRQKEGTVTTYFEAANYLLDTFAIDDVITEIDADMMCFTQLSKKRPTGHTEALWDKALRCNSVQDAYKLKGVFIE